MHAVKKGACVAPKNQVHDTIYQYTHQSIVREEAGHRMQRSRASQMK